MKLNYKLWLENEQGELIIGEGMLKLLNVIKLRGSISEAAKELDMSYRAAWGKIEKVENRLGNKLVEKKTGGKGGGGTTLTKEGEKLLEKFDHINKKTHQAVQRIFRDHF